MNLPISDGVEIIEKVFEKEREARLWDLYVAQYPHMDEEHFMTFEEFMRKSIPQPATPPEPVDEQKIIEMAERIKRADQGQVSKGDATI